MGRRGEHSKEELRGMALAAAARIVAAEGLGGLSARRVAGEIGYTVGTLYLIFRNLDDLSLHVNALTLDDLYAALRRAAARRAQPGACLRALGHTYSGFAERHRNRWEAVFQFQSPDGEALPQWYREKVRRMFELVEQPLAALAPRRAPGEIALAGRALWSGVHGVCMLAHTGKAGVMGVKSMRRLVDVLIDNFLRGFAGGRRDA